MPTKKKSRWTGGKKVRSTGMPGRPSREYFAHCAAMEREFPNTTDEAEIGDDYRVEITTDRGFVMDAMSGCEEIAFDISLNNHWSVRTSALAGRPRLNEGDRVLEFVEQLKAAARVVLKEYEDACMDQMQLDRRWAKEEYATDKERKQCIREFMRDHAKHLARIKAARKGL